MASIVDIMGSFEKISASIEDKVTLPTYSMLAVMEDTVLDNIVSANILLSTIYKHLAKVSPEFTKRNINPTVNPLEENKFKDITVIKEHYEGFIEMFPNINSNTLSNETMKLYYYETLLLRDTLQSLLLSIVRVKDKLTIVQ